jgi:hypothetical protein
MRTSMLASFVVVIALAACSNRTAPSAPAGEQLGLGKDTEVTSGKTYRVGDVVVGVISISMASGMNPQGQDDHWIVMKLRVERAGGERAELELKGDEPGEAAGLVFRADALGYQWGASPATATLRVDRK